MAVTMLIGNKAVIDLVAVRLRRLDRQHDRQLSCNEADDPTVRSALIALGLMLLVVTAGFNILARLLLARLTRARSAGPVAAPAGGVRRRAPPTRRSEPPPPPGSSPEPAAGPARRGSGTG